MRIVFLARSQSIHSDLSYRQIQNITDRPLVNFGVNEKRVLLATVHDLLTAKILAYKTAIAK
ncbi:MAG: hypothetical protein VKL42_06425 [Snowella sp.]|nr:hypothetical protein [Snowella sp.]